MTLLIACCLVGCGRPPVEIPAIQPMTPMQIGRHQLTSDVPGVGQVRYTLEVPETYDGSQPVPLVLFLHYGYQGARPEPFIGSGMIDTFASGLNNVGGIGIAPDVTGGDWLTSDNEIAAIYLVRSAIETYNIDRSRVIVCGFSMGGEGSWFFASRHSELFTGTLPIAAPVAGSTHLRIPAYVVHSKSDQVVSHSAAQTHVQKVRAAGGRVHFESLSGVPHHQMHPYIAGFNAGLLWLTETQPDPQDPTP